MDIALFNLATTYLQSTWKTMKGRIGTMKKTMDREKAQGCLSLEGMKMDIETMMD